MASLRRFLFILFSLVPSYYLCAIVLPDEVPFYSRYQYCRAQAFVIEADARLENLQFNSAYALYLEARDFLECSQIDDRRLEYHIEFGLVFCETHMSSCQKGFSIRVEALYNKFAANPPPVKIKFETVGGTHECQPVYEAQ